MPYQISDHERGDVKQFLASDSLESSEDRL